MIKSPFDIISCSWPRPVEHVGGRWTSEPEWDAPPMPFQPHPRWTIEHGELCRMIDWCELFKGHLKLWGDPPTGEMRGFHIVFHLRIHGTGKLIFWDDDGCLIRRNGQLIHSDPSAHMLTRHEIDVSVGDHLEVAQWQYIGGWLWGARLGQSEKTMVTPTDVLLPYLDTVQQRLRQPNGPPLKMYSHGRTPIRTVVSLYSMILNGYAPSEVFLFGENQWAGQARELFAATLPFASIITTPKVVHQLQAIGGNRLVELARCYWFVMKTCISLLCPPEEFCLMDDDVFILDCVDDALRAFQQYELVFAPDTDHGKTYLATWGWMHGRSEPLRTGTFNAGLYWMKNSNDRRRLAAYVLRVRPNPTAPHLWEQGFIANVYAHKPTFELPTQRYFYPLFDGLPGGLLDYDYACNPCGFASIHYGGLADKPSDTAALHLVPEILGQHTAIASHHKVTATA